MSWKSRRIDDLSIFDPNKRGQKSEDRVEGILHELAAQGKIHHYYRCERGGENDREGIDFLVYPEENWIIPLQVKSSFKRREEHIIRHGNRIPCIVVINDYDDVTLKQRLVKVLGLSVLNLTGVLIKIIREIPA